MIAGSLTRDTKRLTTLAYYASFVGLGLSMATIGPSLDVLRRRTGVSLGTIGVLFTVNAVGYAIGSVLLGRQYDRRPGHPVMAACIAVSAAAVVSIGVLPTLALLSVGVFIAGFAVGGVDTGGNTLLTWVHREDLAPRMIALHASFGLGAAIAPLVIATSRIVSGDIAWGLLLLGVLFGSTAVLLFRLPSPEAPRADRHDAKPEPSTTALLAVSGFFFLYVGLELGYGGWIFTFAEDHGLDPKTTAAWLTSAFWISFTAGRLLGVPIARRFTAVQVLRGDAIGVMAGALLLAAAGSNVALIWAATIVIGVMIATMFPTMMNLANERITLTGRTNSWFIGGAGCGASVLPWAIGALFDLGGTHILPWFVLGAMLLSALMVVAALRALPAPRSV